MTASVWTDRPEYTSNQIELLLIRDILGGTRALRGDAPSLGTIGTADGVTHTVAGNLSQWLPLMPSDSPESYYQRWERAYCNGAFAHTVESIVGKAMSESVRVEKSPSNLEAVETNADRMGTSLTRFVTAHFMRKVAFGGSGILIGMPTIESVPPGRVSPDGLLSEPVKKEFDIRPYLVPVHRLAVRAWEWRDRPGGGRELVFLAIREDNVTRRVGGEFVTMERLRTWELLDAGGGVRVSTYERAADATKRKDGDGETPIEPPAILDLPCIPFIWDACDDPEQTTDPLAISPPLAEIAWLQLQHFRETAEQGVAVYWARAEFIVEEGADDKAAKTPLKAGLGKAMRTSSGPKDHKVYYAGPSGRGVEHGEKSLRHIEDQMERLGAQPLARRAGSETATGKKIDDESRNSIAAQWVESTEDAIEHAYEIADLFARPTETTPVGQRLPDMDICIPGLEAMDQETVSARIEEIRSGVADVGLPKRLYVAALIDSGYLPEGTDVDEVLLEMEKASADELAQTFAAQDRAMRLVAGGKMGSGDPMPAEDHSMTA